MIRRKLQFYSHGLLCDGELLLPENTSAALPVVVMAHGFGTLRYFGLMKFTPSILQKGIAVFMFDYRCFGFSQGEPRQLVDIDFYREDIAAAVDYLKTLKEVDDSRIGVFSYSCSCGPVFEVASHDSSIKAISCIAPFLSTKPFLKRKSVFCRLTLASMVFIDKVRGKLGLNPFYCELSYPSKAVIGSLGIDKEPYDHPDVNIVCSVGGNRRHETVLVEIENKSDGRKTVWENKVPARSYLNLHLYRPYDVLEDVMCSVLIVAGTEDYLSPFESMSLLKDKLRDSEIISFEGGHFDLYKKEIFDDVSKSLADFFEKKLLTF